MSECEGTYWRYTISSFVDKDGNLGRRELVRLLKRKSCNRSCQPSCHACQQDFIKEILSEDISMMGDLPSLPKGVKNGDTLRLVYSYFIDEYELWFEKVGDEN